MDEQFRDLLYNIIDLLHAEYPDVAVCEVEAYIWHLLGNPEDEMPVNKELTAFYLQSALKKLEDDGSDI